MVEAFFVLLHSETPGGKAEPYVWHGYCKINRSYLLSTPVGQYVRCLIRLFRKCKKKTNYAEYINFQLDG